MSLAPPFDWPTLAAVARDMHARRVRAGKAGDGIRIMAAVAEAWRRVAEREPFDVFAPVETFGATWSEMRRELAEAAAQATRVTWPAGMEDYAACVAALAHQMRPWWPGDGTPVFAVIHSWNAELRRRRPRNPQPAPPAPAVHEMGGDNVEPQRGARSLATGAGRQPRPAPPKQPAIGLSGPPPVTDAA